MAIAHALSGGASIPGPLSVGAITSSGAATFAGKVTADSLETNVTTVTYLVLTPQADAPSNPTEGTIYADTDHKLYYWNGSAWKEVTFEA